jgi:hypothetical protein
VRDSNPAFDRCGSWSCENSSDGRTRRNISTKLRIVESNHTARMKLYDVLENCIFYISPILIVTLSLFQLLRAFRLI